MEMTGKKITSLSAKSAMKQTSGGKSAITSLKFKGSMADNSSYMGKEVSNAKVEKLTKKSA